MLLVVGLVLMTMSLTQGQQQQVSSCSRLLTQERRESGFGAHQFVWNASLVLPVNNFMSGWQMTLRFSRPLDVFTNKLAGASSGDNRQFVLRAPDDTLLAGTNLTLRFTAHYTDNSPAVLLESVHFNGRVACNGTDDGISSELLNQVFGTPPPPPQSAPLSFAPPKTLKYDYTEVLTDSLLFYEAQRSGLLPLDNRISWRNDSCSEDRGKNGEDLTGGYFTSGRTMKFTFPNAAATTVLAWGLINHDAGYQAAGQLVLAQDALNWGAKYLAQCHTKQDELYVLVGDVRRENDEYWGRPEDFNFPRPAFAINRTSPGSEVAAEVAAALAASSVALRDYYLDGPALARNYLRHAKQLYELAVNFRGDYSTTVNDVSGFYKSWSGDEDELVWAALWLFRATGEERYRTEAQEMYRRFNLKNRQVVDFSWDDKTLGVQVLLSQMTLDSEHEQIAKGHCDFMSTNPNRRTPKGLYFIKEREIVVGSIRYASNVAYVCFELGELLRQSGASDVNPYLEFALSQVNYILGDTGRSYMIGFGVNPPKKPRHAGSSCPAAPAPCSWEQHNAKGPNPQTLTGALVGGPERNDSYSDTRDNWRENDVGVDYNAGFQSLVAGLMALHQQNKLPNMAYR